MNTSRLLKPILIIEIVFLLGNAVVISRDYQDSWILEGLEIPFAVFMITNVIYFLVEKNTKWLVFFATLARLVIGLLPNLKYEWFLGTSIDQHLQFRLTRFSYDYGYVEGGLGYSETPIMHIFFAMFSEVTSVSVVHSFKYLPVLSWSICPAIIYSILKKTFPEQERIMKFALFISFLPVNVELSHVVTGTLFGSLLVFLVLAEFTEASKTNDRRYLFLAIILSLALVSAHFISSMLLMLGFLIVFLANKIFKFFMPGSVNLRFSVFLVALNLSWLMPQFIHEKGFAGTVGRTVTNFIRGILGLEPRVWSPTGIRPRFFDLDPVDGLRVLTVFHGGDIIVLLLATLGVIIGVKKLGLTSNPLKFLVLYFSSLWLFVPAQLLLTAGKAGLVQYFRVSRNTLVISPILCAFSLYYIEKKMRRAKPVIVIILLMTVTLSTVQMYGCQPLLPRSSAVTESLPSDEPINFLGWTGVNSIYQRSMIQYIEEYASEETKLATDDTTSHQIFGLADYEFSVNQLLYYNPLSRLIDEDVRQRDYDVFLIHLPGKAGGLAEKAEIRTKKLILETILNSSVIYTNGESYVLIYPGL